MYAHTLDMSMARISIYIPDDLKLRMDEVGSDISWSEIARPVFLAALTAHEHRKGNTMYTAIERLRASKRICFESMCSGGHDQGREWARNVAEYYELVTLSDLALPELPYDGDVFDVVREAIWQEAGEPYEQTWDDTVGSELPHLSPYRNEPPNHALIRDNREYRDSHNAFVRAFVEGAVEFYNEVKDKL